MQARPGSAPPAAKAERSVIKTSHQELPRAGAFEENVNFASTRTLA